MEGIDAHETGRHCCPPDAGLLQELSGTAAQLLQQPGVTSVHLRAGCHAIELHRPLPTGAGEGVVGAPATDAARESPEPAVSPGRHRRPG